MTTTIVFANTNDAYLISGDNSYATALAGPADSVSSVSDTALFVGQQKSGTPYTIWQAFLEFGFTPSANSMPVSAYFKVVSSSVTGTSVNRGLDFASFDYGTLTTADWRTPSQLVTLYNTVKAGGVASIQNASNLTVRAGHLRLTELDAAGTKRYIMFGSRNRSQQTPTGLEYNGFRSADFSGSDQDPALYVAEVTTHLLNRSLGAQCQLSDGSHVYVEFASTALGSDIYSVKHRSLAGAVTTLQTIGEPTVIRRGAQSHALARDKFDNVYLMSQSDAENMVIGRAYVKGVGYSWSAQPTRGITLPTYDNDINNIAMAWHPQGGSYGTLMMMVGHQAGSNIANEITNVLVNCDYLVNGSGEFARSVWPGDGFLVLDTATDGYHNFYNETGTLFDVAAAPDGSARGFLQCTSRHHVLGQTSGPVITAYELWPSGDGYKVNYLYHEITSGFSLKDANAKSRVLAISGTQFATVTASPTSGFGVTVKHRQVAGNITTISEVDLDDEGLTTMPAASTLAASSAWDAIYNPRDNRVWIYYFDVANGRRLMRTHVDLNTGQAGLTQQEVNATVGATGSTNLAIRVHRGSMIGEQVLITVANRTSGGTHSLIYVADNINVAPSQPTLLTRANYDSALSALFDWDFRDLNLSDTQSAYRLQIDNATTGASAFDSGKVVSGTTSHTLPGGTIANEQNWKWRVMTWDNQDVASPWSDYGFFTTSAAGTVTITDPSVDNDPSILTANYRVVWSVAGTTQAAYRVIVTRTDTGATLVNTGWVTSTATSYLIQGMTSDIQYTVTVQVRDAALVTSNIATRLITPTYARPEVPIVTFDVSDAGGYIQLSITNPDPLGDRPNPTTNEIHRRVFDATNQNGTYEIIGSTDPNSTFRDYTAASGVLYEYRVRAIAGQFFQDSSPTTADQALDLEGVWLHDPADAATTIRQFVYGKDSRSTSLDTIGTSQQFAGRTFPVVDYGEHESEEISVTVDVPHGPDYLTEQTNLRSFMELKKTLVFRDNRSRAVYGTMSGFQQSDQAWGVTISFRFTRVSYDIEEV